MKKRKYLVLCISALLILLLLVPFPMVVARNCTILVVDNDGKPWANATVTRGWAYGSSQTLEAGLTGPDGTASFATRIQGHSLLGRFFSEVANVLNVHGNVHISDGYLVSFPESYTAAITSDAPFKWVYDEGHFAKVDLSGLPRKEHHQVQFILKQKKP